MPELPEVQAHAERLTARFSGIELVKFVPLNFTALKTALPRPDAAYGLPLKIATTVIPNGGHLNIDAGYGEWPAMLSWCNRDNLAFY